MSRMGSREFLKLGFVVWDLQYFKAHYFITPTLHDRFKFFLT